MAIRTYMLVACMFANLNVFAMESDDVEVGQEEGRVIPASEISAELSEDEEAGNSITKGHEFVTNLKDLLGCTFDDEDTENYVVDLMERGAQQIECHKKGVESEVTKGCCGRKKTKQLMTRHPIAITQQAQRYKEFEVACSKVRSRGIEPDSAEGVATNLINQGLQAALAALITESQELHTEQKTEIEKESKSRNRWKFSSIAGITSAGAAIAALVIQSGAVPTAAGLLAALIESYID